jgi:hypothetical protein
MMAFQIAETFLLYLVFPVRENYCCLFNHIDSCGANAVGGGFRETKTMIHYLFND